MSTTSAINLQNIPPPDIVETLDFEVILAELIADYLVRNPEHTALLESDPLYKEMEVFAYREMLLRQRVNNAVKAVLLASATGGDLDQTSANLAVYRFPAAKVTITGGGGTGATAEAVIVDGVIQRYNVTNPGTGYTSLPTVTIEGSGSGATATPVIAGGVLASIGGGGGLGYYEENDESLRYRAQLAFETFSTAGPEGAYIFHAISADPRVRSIGVYGPADEPGNVYVTVQSNAGSGIASNEILNKVTSALNEIDTRPLTDHVIVRSVVPLEYQINATLRFYAGPDRAVVLQKAKDALTALVTKLHAVSRDVSLSAIYAALHQEGVSRVILTTPLADIIVTEAECAYCISDFNATILDGGVGE